MFLFTFFFSLLSWVNASNTALDSDPANLYISTNNGKSWEGFACGLPQDLMVRDVVEYNGTIYLSAIRDGFYVLEKDSDTWVKRSDGLPIAQFNNLPLGGTQQPDFFPTSLAADGDQLILGTFNRGVYHSSDAGKTWKQASTNIDDVIGALYFSNDLLIAGTHTGIWESKDRGVNWELRCETGFRINVVTMHNGQLHVARQNGMGILIENDIQWADMKTDWAIGQLLSDGGQLYAITAKNEVFRTSTGEYWENNKFAIKGLPSNTLTEALWGGFIPLLPNRKPPGIVTQTSRGWIVGVGGGC